jgi:hypothetical protein
MFDSEFSLDRFRLEEEAERNSSLMRKYGKLLSLTKAKVRDYKRRMDILEAELILEYRQNRDKYNVKGVSDSVIAKIVKKDNRYSEMYNDWMEWTRKSEDADNAVKSIEQKGWMIKIEAELWLNNYFSRPTVYQRKPKRIELTTKEINNGTEV